MIEGPFGHDHRLLAGPGLYFQDIGAHVIHLFQPALNHFFPGPFKGDQYFFPFFGVFDGRSADHGEFRADTHHDVGVIN